MKTQKFFDITSGRLPSLGGIQPLTLIIPFLFLLSSCGQQPEGGKGTPASPAVSSGQAPVTVELTKEQVAKTGITLGDFERRNLRDVLKVNGYLHVPPQNKAEISTFMGGVVRSVLVREGDYVIRGQALLELTHPDFLKLQEDYLVTKSGIGFSRNEYERQKSLSGDNISSQKAFQEAEARYNSEKARLASLSDQLRLLNVSAEDLSPGNLQNSFRITSPIGGYVGKINVNTGTFAEPQKELLCVIDNSRLHADLMIYEKDLDRIRPGQKVSITFTNLPGKLVTAKIFSVGKEFEKDSRTVSAHAELLNTDTRDLVPGMYVNGLIGTGDEETPALPESAIVRDQGKNYIFIVDPSLQKHREEVAFTPVEVKRGVTDGGYSEVTVLGHLPGKYQVVTTGAYYVLSQMNLGKGAGCVD